MKKNLKNLLIGTGILAMVLTPAAMVSSIYNDEIEPAALSTTEKTTGIDNSPQIMEMTIDNEGEGSVEFTGIDYYDNSMYVADLRSYNVGGYTYEPGIVLSAQVDAEGNPLFDEDGRPITKEDLYRIDKDQYTNQTVSIEYEFIDDYGIIFNEINMYDEDGYGRSMQYRYIPNEVIAKGPVEVQRFIAMPDAINEYDSDYQAFTTMEDGEAYFAISYGSDFQTVRPLILHITWPDEYNMDVKKNDSYDLFYTKLNEDELSAEIKFKSKKMNWFKENNFNKNAKGWLGKRIEWSTYFETNNENYVEIIAHQDYVDPFSYGKQNIVTNTSKLLDFNITDKEFAYDLTTQTYSLDYYFFQKIDSVGAIEEEYDKLMQSYFDNNFTWTVEEDEYGKQKIHYSMNNGLLMHEETNGGDQPIQLITDPSTNDVYMGIPFSFEYDPTDHYSDVFTNAQYKQVKKFIEENVDSDQYIQLLDNTQALVQVIGQMKKSPFSSSYSDWIDVNDYNFVSVIDENGNVKNSILTTTEAILITITTLILLLLILIIVLLIKKSKDEDLNIKIVNSKEGGK